MRTKKKDPRGGMFVGMLFTATALFHFLIVDFKELKHQTVVFISNHKGSSFYSENDLKERLDFTLICPSSDKLLKKLKKGDNIKVWYQIIPFSKRPEVWQLSNSTGLLCSYESTLKKEKTNRNVFLSLSFLVVVFIFIKYLRSNKRKIVSS